MGSQWRIQRGFNGFHGTPLLKGCLRKYYAQTYYVHYTHTRATHFSFTVAITPHVSTHVSRIRRAHDLPEEHDNHRDNERSERANESKDFIHALLPLQLGMVICYQYESAYFPAPYAANPSCYAASATRSGVTPLILRGPNTTTRFSSSRPTFGNFTTRIHQKRSQKVFAAGGGGGWGGMPPAPSI